MENFKQDLIAAAKHCFKVFIYWFFISPFDLYVKVTKRLVEQQNNDFLRISKINSPFPIFVFFERFLTKFIFDFLSFMAYPVGILVGIFLFCGRIYAYFGMEEQYREMMGGFSGSLEQGVIAFVLALICAYYIPILFQLTRDLIQFSLLPFKKLLSYLKKPAQYVYIKKEKVN